MANAASTLLLVAGDGASLSDAASDAGGAPATTVSIWRLPAPDSAAAQSTSGAVPTLLCSYGKCDSWAWPWAGRLAASEPYCGWTLSVSPDGQHIAVAQPGAELLLLDLQVGALRMGLGCCA